MAWRHGLTRQQLFSWRRLARQIALSAATIFVPAVVEPAAPERPMLVKTPRRVRRRSSVDGIELEIAGVEVRIGADAKPRSIEAVIRGGEESGYVAECMEIPVVTQGATLDETTRNLQEAVALHLEDEDLSSIGLAANPMLLVTMELEPAHA